MEFKIERRGQGLKGKKAYNNGVKNIYLFPHEPIPEGFVKGVVPYYTEEMKQRASQKAKQQWEDENYRKQQTLSHLGKSNSNKGKICITDSISDKFIFFEELSYFSEWHIGSHKKGKPLSCDVWNKGLTKETDERVAKNGRAVAIALIGNIPWNKGLTAETDPRIKAMAEKQIGKVITAEQRAAISKANKGREQSTEEIERRAEALRQFWRTNPDKLAERKAYFKEYYSDPEVRKACSERAKLRIKEDPTIITRGIETKRKNGTFHVSLPEKEFYEILVTEYGEEDIVTQYKDNRYPFRCDFYIKSLDLFIELNLHPTHGTHPFDPERVEDVLLLMELEKQNTQWSKNIINVWAVRDYNKIQTAIKNNLNYKVIYEREYSEKSYTLN